MADPLVLNIVLTLPASGSYPQSWTDPKLQQLLVQNGASPSSTFTGPAAILTLSPSPSSSTAPNGSNPIRHTAIIAGVTSVGALIALLSCLLLYLFYRRRKHNFQPTPDHPTQLFGPTSRYEVHLSSIPQELASSSTPYGARSKSPHRYALSRGRSRLYSPNLVMELDSQEGWPEKLERSVSPGPRSADSGMGNSPTRPRHLEKASWSTDSGDTPFSPLPPPTPRQIEAQQHSPGGVDVSPLSPWQRQPLGLPRVPSPTVGRRGGAGRVSGGVPVPLSGLRSPGMGCCQEELPPSHY